MYEEKDRFHEKNILASVPRQSLIPHYSTYIPAQLTALFVLIYFIYAYSQVWNTISPSAKDLLHQMLHIVPQRRPTASQILRHPWIVNAPIHLEHTITLDPVHVAANVSAPPSVVHNSNTAALKGAVAATFRAIASPQAANVGPVGMSELARRRARDKPISPMPR